MKYTIEKADEHRANWDAAIELLTKNANEIEIAIADPENSDPDVVFNLQLLLEIHDDILNLIAEKEVEISCIEEEEEVVMDIPAIKSNEKGNVVQ
jgi:hypothetical protein